MRASSLLATFVIGVVCTAANAHASEPAPKTTPGATAKPPAAPPAKTASSGKEKKPGEPAAPGAPRQGTVPVAAPADAPKQESLEEIVARVRRRLAMDRAPKRSASAPAPAPAARAEAPPRVSLVWRPYVVWPDELTSGNADAAPSPDTDRVMLKWEAAGQ